MLSKQSIRGKVEIYHEGTKLTKDDIIELSKEWSEIQENFFRKMLKQGGKFSIDNRKFTISVPELIYNNKGEVEGALYDNEE